jgi:charged multivesicular body protein 5
MNRLFGTKKKEEPKIVAPVKEEPKIDLVEQAKKVENRVNELDGKVNAMDAEIQQLYLKLRSCRGTQRDFMKQKLVHLLKRRKLLGGQQKNYFSHQMALENVAFTQENIQNTMEMVSNSFDSRPLL